MVENSAAGCDLKLQDFPATQNHSEPSPAPCAVPELAHRRRPGVSCSLGVPGHQVSDRRLIGAIRRGSACGPGTRGAACPPPCPLANAHQQVAGLLGCPGPSRMSGDAQDVHRPGWGLLYCQSAAAVIQTKWAVIFPSPTAAAEAPSGTGCRRPSGFCPLAATKKAPWPSQSVTRFASGVSRFWLPG
jgi:hypothetical protein